MEFSVTEIRKFKTGNAAVWVTFDGGLRIKYNVFKSQDGRTFAFPPQEKGKDGKSFNVVMFPTIEDARAVQATVLEAYEADQAKGDQGDQGEKCPV